MTKSRAQHDTSGMGQNIIVRLDALTACTDEPGRITRLYLGPAHRKAADLVATWLKEAGLSTRVDAVTMSSAATKAPAMALPRC